MAVRRASGSATPVRSRKAQRGIALLGLLAIMVLVFAYVLTSRLNAASRFVALDRDQNALVMARAKRALIGYVAQQASLASENNPGSLPCPEAPAFFGNPTQEGIAAGNCALPAVGRLPWRTLGLEKLVDAAGEPLWYVVSPGWALPNSTTPTVINSESLGQLTFNGVANDAVALIVAPGPAIVVQAGAGCAAWTQTRPASGPPDKRNYLECGNATNSFVGASPGNTFNDQALRVTTADVMPALEAAIQERAQREIAPALRDAAFQLDSNNPRRWVSSTGNPPLYPFAAPFGDPASSSYRGVAGTYQGLLPMAPVAGFVAFAATPSSATKTTAAGSINSQTCFWESSTVYACEGEYQEDGDDPSLPITLQMTATFTNVAMGLRTLQTSKLTAKARDNDGSSSWSSASVSTTKRVEMNDGLAAGKPLGSVTVRLTATVPNIDAMGWDTRAEFQLRLDLDAIGDHCLLSTTSTSCAGANTSWFARNQWHRAAYYALAQANSPSVLPSVGGCDSTNCLRFNNPSLYNIRTLLVLAGRKLDTQNRPVAALADFLEHENANTDTLYEQRPMRAGKVVASPMNAPWNDRVVLADWISPPVFPAQVQAAAPAPVRVVALP